ncbi:MAG: PhnD/SsuA/transferrin family substrate-binding protein [Chloroflexota bacterium]
MKKIHIKWSVIALLVGLLALVACQPEVQTETVEVEVTRVVPGETVVEEREVEIEVEVTRIVEVVEQAEMEAESDRAPLGSEERPIKVLFVPSVEAAVIVSGGQVMADALEEATGLKFEVIVPTSYAAAIEEMCASPDDTIGFIPALGYVLANERCGVTVGAAAVRFGLSWYASQFVVRADSGIETIEDLAGKTWCVPDFGSTSGYLYPQVFLQENGIEPGETSACGGHGGAMSAVFTGEADFATAYFSPPLLPSGQWQYGVDDPEIWREAGEDPERMDNGHILVAGGPDEGGYRILDAREPVAATYPEIFEETEILALTPQIPNDTVSFGPDFPFPLAQRIIDSLVEFTQTDACQESICSGEFYSWTGIDPVSDSFYDPVRSFMTILGLTEEDIFN